MPGLEVCDQCCELQLDDRAEKQLEEVADAPEVCAAIQRYICRLEKWIDRNLAKFNTGKLQVMHLGRNPIHQYMLGATRREAAW